MCLTLTFLAFVCAGANFVTCIQGLLLLLGYTVIAFIRDKRKALWYIPAILVYAFGLKLNLTAPGNLHRQASYQGEGAIAAIVDSLKEGVVNTWKFSGLFVLLLMVMCGMEDGEMAETIYKKVPRWSGRLGLE